MHELLGVRESIYEGVIEGPIVLGIHRDFRVCGLLIIHAASAAFAKRALELELERPHPDRTASRESNQAR